MNKILVLLQNASKMYHVGATETSVIFEFDEANYVNPRHLYRIFISEANPEFVRLILSTPWGV